MPENTLNSGKQNPPAESLQCEPWTLKQAANWILFRDLDRARRADGGPLKSGRYLSHYDSDLPKKRDGESDTEVSDRMEAYLQKRRDAEDDERSRWPGAEAELIESLKRAEVVARSIKNDGTTIPPDAWKTGSRTFFEAGDARVLSDEIMTKWRPTGQTERISAPSTFTNKPGPKPTLRQKIAAQMVQDFKSGQTLPTDTLENLKTYYGVAKQTAKFARADALAQLQSNSDRTLTER